ncbi:MAG: hypothetical protein ACRCZB_04080 [Bacteroidales bacterium]
MKSTFIIILFLSVLLCCGIAQATGLRVKANKSTQQASFSNEKNTDSLVVKHRLKHGRWFNKQREPQLLGFHRSRVRSVRIVHLKRGDDFGDATGVLSFIVRPLGKTKFRSSIELYSCGEEGNKSGFHIGGTAEGAGLSYVF